MVGGHGSYCLAFRERIRSKVGRVWLWVSITVLDWDVRVIRDIGEFLEEGRKDLAVSGDNDWFGEVGIDILYQFASETHSAEIAIGLNVVNNEIVFGVE